MKAIILVALLNSVLGWGPDGRCGSDYSCPQYSPCCSKHGYCGSTWEYCAPEFCIGPNCWKSNIPPKGWLADDPVAKIAGIESTSTSASDDELTESQLGIFRNIKRFPEEIFGVYVRCIDPGVVALTFDDGPSSYTPKLLDILKAEDVKATFFVLARNIDPQFTNHWKGNQSTLRRIVTEGHLVGSHSYNHPNFIHAGSWATEHDMTRADGLFKSALGFCPRIMRPPEGAINADIAQTLHRLGFFIVNWSHDTNDWRYIKYNPKRSLQYVKSRVPLKSLPKTDSVILLQHDTYENTVNAQKEIIAELKAKGYQFVTLDKCIGVDRPYRLSPAGSNTD